MCVGWRQQEVRALLPEVPAAGWHRLSCGAGAKGPRVYDWVVCPVNGPDSRRLLIRRSVADPSAVAYFLYGGPPVTPLGEFVRVAGTRWAVAEYFGRAKSDCGLDEYEVRSWVGWYRHLTPGLFALAVLAVIQFQAAQPPRKRGRR